MNYNKNMLWALLIPVALCIAGCTSQRQQINITASKGDQVMDFAVSEIREILKRDFDVVQNEAMAASGWNIVLKTDAGLKPFSFALVQSGEESRKTILLSGHDQTCVLNSVYTMLEKMGYVFDITGIRYPDNPSLKALTGLSDTIVPVVQRRGIRQHINFMMDISSYPLDEAKEYVRNLARLRMNFITFHSYPGQWFAYEYKGKVKLAGSFFYGEQGVVPKENNLKKVIRNSNIYCIPAIEPYWNDTLKRSGMAIEWLNSVMAEAKKVGLTVNLSYELRERGIDYAMATSTAILKEYPLIDGLEMISEEDIGTYLEQIRNDISCTKELKKQLTGRKLTFVNGIYNTKPSELKPGFELLRDSTDKDMVLSILPAHGARKAVRNLAEIPLTAADLQRTMIYSWIEFDGLMYLQQNPVEGIRMMIGENLMISGNQPLYGICWNHWRTAENRVALKYASEAMIGGPEPPEAFYRALANSTGIGDPGRFATAMAKLDDTDTYCRDNLFNIGFCWNGYWLTKAGLSIYGGYHPDKLTTAIARFNGSRNDFDQCSLQTRNKLAKKDLQLLVNRIDCTMLHLRAFVAMTDLVPLFKLNLNPDLSNQEREKVISKCTEALALETQYVNLHAGQIADRGCEGTLVSYLGGPYQTLKNIISKYEKSDENVPKAGKSSDAPPEPGQNHEKNKK